MKQDKKQTQIQSDTYEAIPMINVQLYMPAETRAELKMAAKKYGYRGTSTLVRLLVDQFLSNEREMALEERIEKERKKAAAQAIKQAKENQKE